MHKTTSIYVCQQCGYQSPQFLGRCPQCQAWNSLVEEVEESQKSSLGKTRDKQGKRQKYGSFGRASIINLADVQKEYYDRLSTGISEFDRVLGGGIVPGALVLISGDPGIGKSTLLTQLALNLNQVLYVSGEESAHQIKIRANRIKQKADLAVLNEVDIDIITQVIGSAKYKLVIVDSIQTIQTTDLQSAAGSIGQVRECAHRLQRVAKINHIPIFIVGHVTKEGTVAGPKTLEHLVDVVLSLEGDPENELRILRGNKNRFGSTSEIGIFDMGEGGMVEVKNPSKIFLSQKVNAPGSVVVSTITGLRPILIEIQALVVKSNLAVPRRVANGIDNNRLMLLTAVLSKRLGLHLFDQDIFVNITGGIRADEPACDLGICMAIISSYKNKTINPETVFLGEIGLLGELRGVRGLDKRIAEAGKLGYTRVIGPGQAKSLEEACILAPI